MSPARNAGCRPSSTPCRVRRNAAWCFAFCRCHRSSTDRWCSCLMVRVSPGRVRVTALPVAGAVERRWTDARINGARGASPRNRPRGIRGRAINPGWSIAIACLLLLALTLTTYAETPECRAPRWPPVSGLQLGVAALVITSVVRSPVVVDHVVVPDVHDRRRDDRPAGSRPVVRALGDAGDALRGSCLSSRSSCSLRTVPPTGSPSSRLWGSSPGTR